GDAEFVENAAGYVFDAIGEGAFQKHPIDRPVGPLGLRSLDLHVERRGDDTATVRVADVQVKAGDRQLAERVLEHREGDPEVEQGGNGHVASDAAEGVEEEELS